MNLGRKAYIGDGCYVEYDGFAFVVTTENGIRVTNRIVLEPSVYVALARYVDQVLATPSSEIREAKEETK